MDRAVFSAEILSAPSCWRFRGGRGSWRLEGVPSPSSDRMGPGVMHLGAIRVFYVSLEGLLFIVPESEVY